MSFRLWLIALLTSVFVAPAFAIEVTNFHGTNVSPENEFRTGNNITREFRTSLSTTVVNKTGNIVTFGSQFSWFHGMRVNQPEAPNFALLYRHNAGYELAFTVEDPLNEGYTIDVDYLNRGYHVIQRDEPIQINAGGGLMLGRLDANDGNGPVHYGGFFIGAGGLAVSGSDPDPFQKKFVEEIKTFTAPTTYVGTRTFVISFGTFPSPTIMNLFQNYGGGESIVQFGIASSYNGSGVLTEPNFQFDETIGNEVSDLEDLGQFVKVTVTGQGMGCEPSEEICDGLDNDCDGDVDEEFARQGETCSVGVGSCEVAGTISCVDGVTSCDATPGEPIEELCDGLDNDCDGSTDEDFPSLEETCTVGVGECTNEGVVVCDATGRDTICSVEPRLPQRELCDNLDNDCDGDVDEEVDSDGDGVFECAGEDLCMDSQFLQIEISDIKPNHYIAVPGEEFFVTSEKTKKNLQISLEETNGCTCLDLVSMSDEPSNGLLKNGCPYGVLQSFLN